MMLSLLTGFGVGLAAGMLFAPKSGEHTREYLGSVASGGFGYVTRQADELREGALDAIDRGRTAINRRVERFADTGQRCPIGLYTRTNF